MKKMTIIAVMMTIVFSASAEVKNSRPTGNGFRDSILEKKCVDVIKSALFYEENAEASVLLCESAGAIKAMVKLTKGNGNWSVKHDIVRNLRPAHYRAILYLCLLQAGECPSDVYFAPSIYHDVISGCTIRDIGDCQKKEMPLFRGMDFSDTCILLACESTFDRNMGDLAVALRHAGAFLGDEDKSENDFTLRNRYKNNKWNGAAILGYHDYMSNAQLVMWMGGIANHGMMIMPRLSSEEPIKVIYDQFSRLECIDSLRAALRQSVIDGMSQNANSSILKVYGLSNVTEQTATFLGFTEEYEKKFPSYTICVTVKGGKSIDCNLPCIIAKNVFDYITTFYDNPEELISKRIVFGKEVKNQQCHVAEKGR